MHAGPSHGNMFPSSISSSLTTSAIQPSSSVHLELSQTSSRTMQPITSSGQIGTSVQNMKVTDFISTSKLHLCTFCNKKFSSRYNVTRHERICKSNPSPPLQNSCSQLQVNIPKPFQCFDCQKLFPSQESLNQHIKKCSKNSRGGGGIQMVQYTGRKQHICKYCAKEFSTKWNVYRHIKLFHNESDPILVTNTNGIVMQKLVTAPGKPERFCRFCGNYFSSKYNAHRHEKICSKAKEHTSTAVAEPQVSLLSTQTDTSTVQAVNMPVTTLGGPITLQVSGSAQQTIVQLTPSQLQSMTQQQATQQTISELNHQQNQKQPEQQAQQQQQIIQVHSTANHPGNTESQEQDLQPQLQIQTQLQLPGGTQRQIIPQQTMVLIEQPQPTTPFHVCKFCNKQMDTRCEPIGHASLSNAQMIVTGQPMLPLSSSGTHITNLVSPVVASIPQVALVQPSLQTLQQPNSMTLGQTLIQQPQQSTLLQQNQQQHLSQDGKNQQTDISSLQPHLAQTNQISNQNRQTNRKKPNVHIRQMPLQHTQQQINSHPQQITVATSVVNEQLQIQHVQSLQTARIVPQHQQTHQQTSHQRHTSDSNSGGNSNGTEVKNGCKYCEKAFATKWYLDQHEKIHTGEADSCDECGKQFVTRWHLDKHKRVHSQNNEGGSRSSSKKSKKETNNSASSVPRLPPPDNGSLVRQSTVSPFPPQISLHHTTVNTLSQHQPTLKQVLVPGIDPQQHTLSVHGHVQQRQAASPAPSSASNRSVSVPYSASHAQYFVSSLAVNSSKPQVSAVNMDSSSINVSEENSRVRKASSHDQHSTIDKSQLTNPITPFSLT